MASTVPVRLIRVQPNPVFQEPKHLPIKPLTQAPIDIERPSDYLTSCIHRADFKDIHPDLLKDYAKHYDIKIDHEKVLRAEVMAVICMKNEWIPILPQHNPTHTEDGHVLLSSTTNRLIVEDDGEAPLGVSGAEAEAYIPDLFCIPEDSYDDDTGSSTEEADPNPKNSDGDITGDFDFDKLPSTLSLGDLAKLTSRLQARHTQVQSALKDATAATREAAANVLEMMARLENEKTRMKKIMATVSEIVGEYYVETDDNELNEGNNEEVDGGDESIQSEKRKGKGRATEPILSSAHSSFSRERNFPGLRCPNCRVARDLTVSQRHSVYLCAEHMPNPYKTNGSPNEGSRVPTSATGTSSSSSVRSDHNTRTHKRSLHPSSTSRDSTIIFGLTTPSKGKKRSLEDSEGSHLSSTSRYQSPKRARVEEFQDDIADIQDPHSLRNSSSISTPPPKKGAPLRRISKINDPEGATAVRRGTPLRRTISISDINDPEEVANAQREEASAPGRGTPLRRSFSINDINDPEEVAHVERMESSCSPSPGRDAPLRTPSSGNPNPEVGANPERTSTPRTNAPSRHTLSISDLNDPEEVANAARFRRGHAQPANFKTRGPSISSSRNAPLRRTISITDLNDLEEVANAEREENAAPREPARSGWTMSIDGGGTVVRGQDGPTTSEPLRRDLAINDPVEVARVETLTTARAEPRMPVTQGAGVRRVLSGTLTRRTATPVTNGDAHEPSGSQQVIVPPSGKAEPMASGSSSLKGRRPRDLDDDGEEGQERAQKKARITEASDA